MKLNKAQFTLFILIVEQKLKEIRWLNHKDDLVACGRRRGDQGRGEGRVSPGVGVGDNQTVNPKSPSTAFPKAKQEGPAVWRCFVDSRAGPRDPHVLEKADEFYTYSSIRMSECPATRTKMTAAFCLPHPQSSQREMCLLLQRAL